MSHPYRTAAISRPNPNRAIGSWRRYIVAGRVFTAMRWAYYLAILAGAAFADADSLPFFVGYPMLLGVAYWFVAYAKCPFCVGEIARGPKQRSYLPVMFGHYPRQCTHCDAPVGATEYIIPEPDAAPPRGPTRRTKSKKRQRRPQRELSSDVLFALDGDVFGPASARRTRREALRALRD